MKKVLCSECKLKKHPHATAIRSVEGKENVVCKTCWIRLDYGTFLEAV